jgi:hypothetical protein
MINRLEKPEICARKISPWAQETCVPTNTSLMLIGLRVGEFSTLCFCLIVVVVLQVLNEQ